MKITTNLGNFLRAGGIASCLAMGLVACGGGGGDDKGKGDAQKKDEQVAKEEDSSSEGDVVVNAVEGPTYALEVDGRSMREMDEDIKNFYKATAKWSIKATVGKTSSVEKKGLSLEQAYQMLGKLKFQEEDETSIEVFAYIKKESEVVASNSAERLGLSCRAETSFKASTYVKIALVLCSRWQTEIGAPRGPGDDNISEQQTISYRCKGKMKAGSDTSSDVLIANGSADCVPGYRATTTQSLPQYFYPAKSQKFKPLQLRFSGTALELDGGGNMFFTLSRYDFDMPEGCYEAEMFIKYKSNPDVANSLKSVRRIELARYQTSDKWNPEDHSKVPSAGKIRKAYQLADGGDSLDFNLLCVWERVANEPLAEVPVEVVP